MKKITCLLLLILLPGLLSASMIKMTVSDAVKNKLIKLSAVNTEGKYMGQSVTLTVTSNNKKDSLGLTVDLGIILKPDNSQYQPMVLAGQENLVLAPGAKGDVDVVVFCGNSPRHCPEKNLHYSYLKLGSDTLIKVLRFIHHYELFDYLGQSGVWAITNGHSLTSVYEPQRDSLSRGLIDVICSVTGRPHPEYYTMTAKNQNPGEPAYTPKTLKIIAPFDLSLRTPTLLTAAVFDEHDHQIEQVFERKMFAGGKLHIDATFDAEKYSPGTYYVRIMDAEKVLREKKVLAEQ